MDIVVNAERLPEEGETLLGSGMSEVPGGKGANQAAAIGKLGMSVSMIGKVGADANGARLIASLQQAGVDTESIMTSDSATGLALITVDGAGRNHIIVVPGANGDLTTGDIDLQRHTIENCEIVVLQLEIPLETALYTLRLAKELGKTTVLNPAPAQLLSEDLLQFVDFLIPNEHELRAITGEARLNEAGLLDAAAVLVNKGTKAVIVTLGDKGCCYSDGREIEFYSAFKVNALDTTAAGDSFIGGFAAGYAEVQDVSQAVSQAIKAAAITVTRRGAQSSLPTRDEVTDFKFEEKKRDQR